MRRVLTAGCGCFPLDPFLMYPVAVTATTPRLIGLHPPARGAPTLGLDTKDTSVLSAPISFLDDREVLAKVLTRFNGFVMNVLKVSAPYSSGFITELIGISTTEKIGYQDVASIMFPKCRKHTTMKGSQAIKSVRIIALIFTCILMSRFLQAALFIATLFLLD